MKKYSAILIALSVALAACQQPSEEKAGTEKSKENQQQKTAMMEKQVPEAVMMQETMPAADGMALKTYITETAPYEKWELWPGKGRLYPGSEPHGAYLTTYVNAAALEAITAKAGTLPGGAMVVKENYTPGKELAAITVMYKVNDYNPDGGNWYWLKYTPDGTVEAEGKVDGCINCHSNVRSSDWMFTYK